jgi:hypothetical protein
LWLLSYRHCFLFYACYAAYAGIKRVFFCYWLFQVKKQMLLSGVILLIGITFISKMFKFSANVQPEEPSDFTLMSYNVRLFNLYEWLPDHDIPQKIAAFVKEKNPDILCLQEYSKQAVGDTAFKQYRHRFIFSEKGQTEQAIFSKFPIINTGDIQFPSRLIMRFGPILKKVKTPCVCTPFTCSQ